MATLQKMQPGMVEIKTIETDRYENMDDGIHVKHVGMIKAQDAFDQLKAHLEKVGLLPDEYFDSNAWSWKGEQELPNYIRASCDVNWGGSEGIYFDISLLYRENNEIKRFNLATGKTLGETGDDYLKMSRIAAECSMMLNGRGSLVRVSENAYENNRFTEQEKRLIAKALDALGDRVADTEGYSAGEEYWSLAKRFEPKSKEESNEFLKGKSAGFVEVYKLVKEARLSNPVNTKALNDIECNYGNDLYKEVLDVVLKEQSANLYSQMQKSFNALPVHLNKSKITPYIFYETVNVHAKLNESPFKELKSSFEALKLSFTDDEFIEMFNDIQSPHKPSLASQIQAAEAKTANNSSDTKSPSKETEPTR